MTNKNSSESKSSTVKKIKERPTILVLIDWDNLFLNLIDAFKPNEVKMLDRFKKLKEWLNDIGKIWAVFVFAPPHLSPYQRQILQESDFFTVICDKIEPKETDGDIREIDTVDDELIKFGELIISHPDITHLCLVSGDDDFIPLLKRVKREGKKIAIAPASMSSLSRNLIPLIDKNPDTGKKMILILGEL